MSVKVVEWIRVGSLAVSTDRVDSVYDKKMTKSCIRIRIRETCFISRDMPISIPALKALLSSTTSLAPWPPPAPSGHVVPVPPTESYLFLLTTKGQRGATTTSQISKSEQCLSELKSSI